MLYPDYPFRGQHTRIRGLQLHFLDEGPKASPPLVMLHGNPSWSYYYRHLVLALQTDFRCIVPDHIGMGLSEKPREQDYEFTLDRRADDLEALLETVGVKENITLVLHDWGGMIGMRYAMRHADKIKRLVILNTAAFHLPAGKRVPWQLTLSRVPLLNMILNQGLNAFCRGAVKYCVTRQPMSAEVAAAYLAPYNSWQSRLAVRKFVEAIPLQPGHQAYAAVEQVDKALQRFSTLPMLICWGLQDFVFDGHYLNEWESRFPQAQVQRFEDAGHYILEDAAADVIPLIRQFLEKNPISQ